MSSSPPSGKPSGIAVFLLFYVLTNILYLLIRKTQQTVGTNGSLVNVLTLLPPFCANVDYLKFLLDFALQILNSQYNTIINFWEESEA